VPFVLFFFDKLLKIDDLLRVHNIFGKASLE